jgi:hypothetical protein
VEAVSSGEAADELVESSIGDLNEVLAQYGKQIDESTPRDGHCLYHALRKLNFVGSEVSISEMRSKAVAAADVEMLAVAGLNMGRSLDEHTAKQLTDDYADDCILGALARAYDRSITVVHLTSIRSFTPLSGYRWSC